MCKLKVISQEEYEKIQKEKREKELHLEDKHTPNIEEFKACTHKSHNVVSSCDKNKVPISKFFKNAKYSKNLYQQCEECRIYRHNLVREKKDKFVLEKLKNEGTPFSTCGCLNHHNISKYPRNEVPKELFLRNPKDPNSEILNYCLDCRQSNNLQKNERKETRKQEASENGKFCCNDCCVVKEKCEIGLNRDGTESNTCKSCKENKNERTKEIYDEMKLLKIKIMLEIILKRGYSCECCYSIFLSQEGNRVLELHTYLENNIRMVEYLEKKYTSIEFVKLFQDKLELRIMDFDHLPENEQIERGIIKDGDAPYVKNKYVGSHSNEFSMRNEVKGCQLIDCLCHLKITIKREKGVSIFTKSEQIKRDYVNSIKRNGCSLCGYFEKDLYRAIDMDHIDPQFKGNCIAIMVKDPEVTLEQLIEECYKTRPLCKFCHRIHTCIQREQGIVTNYKGK